ncbi:hypothetical protein [Thermococcus sp.]
MVPFPPLEWHNDKGGSLNAIEKVRKMPDGNGLILPRIREEFNPWNVNEWEKKKKWALYIGGFAGDGAKGLKAKHAVALGFAGAMIKGALYFMGMHPDDADTVHRGALDDTTRKQPADKIYDPKFHEEALEKAALKVTHYEDYPLREDEKIPIGRIQTAAEMLKEAAGIIPAAIEAGKAFGEVVEQLKKNGVYPDAKNEYYVFTKIVDDPMKFRKIKYYAGDAGKEFLKKLHAAHIIAYELAPEAYKERSAVEPYLTEEEKKETEKMAEEWKRFAREKIKGHIKKGIEWYRNVKPLL